MKEFSGMNQTTRAGKQEVTRVQNGKVNKTGRSWNHKTSMFAQHYSSKTTIGFESSVKLWSLV